MVLMLTAKNKHFSVWLALRLFHYEKYSTLSMTDIANPIQYADHRA